jgi:uncharacterized protein YndB with AHSA1/START domain
MNEFEIVTIIDRPVETVFSALQDFEKAPRWNPGLTEVRLTSDGPLGVGSTVVYVGRFLGRGYESPSEYTEYVANERFVSVTTSGPFHLEVENSLESVGDGDGTRLTVVYRGESRGFFKLAEPVVFKLTKKHFETATENLKELLEADAL